MSKTLNSITLPVGLIWADKYDWTAISQSIEVCLNGTLLVEEASQSAGRPITLVGGAQSCWIKRVDLDALVALTQTAGATLTLDLGSDGNYNVIWNRAAKPISAEPVQARDDMVADDWYVLKQLNFIAV